MFSLFVVLFLQSAQQPGLPIGVGAELLARNLPVPKDAADLEQPISSYSVLDDPRGFVIAYYHQKPDNRLHELLVRSYDKRTRVWRSKTFPEPIGGVISIQRAAGYLYITGHSTPSAAPLLVLSEGLERRRELDGWSMLVLGDGRVVFHRSMVHFAPAHAAALALYDPAADREVALYPPPGVDNKRGGEQVPGTELWMDRSFTDVKEGKAPGTIEFVAFEQRLRLTPQNAGEAAGPSQRLVVSCNVRRSPPTCRRSGIQDSR